MRFTSLASDRPETRRILRDRLARYLPVLGIGQTRDAAKVSDEAVLRLLLNIEVVNGGSENEVREVYENDRQKHPLAPAYETLVAEGWVRVVWGRVHADMETRSMLRRYIDDVQSPIKRLLDNLHPEPSE